MADGTLFEEQEKITLFSVANSEILVWNAEDVFTLRTKHRIVGSLIGSLPRKPKQNVCLSLPLLLSKDETTLLLQKKITRLVESPENPPLPTQEEAERFEILRNESIKGQLELFREENQEKEMAGIIEAGRKTKKRKKRKRRHQNSHDMITPAKVFKTDNNDPQLQESNEIKLEIDHKDFKPILCEDIRHVISPQHIKLPVDINRTEQSETSDTSTKRPSSADNTGTDKVQATIQEQRDLKKDYTGTLVSFEDVQREQACAIHIPTKLPLSKTKDFPIAKWTYPDTQLEKLKFKVFSDLWERGYYITSGSKFGGDFLAYPGDPFKFHSFYIVMVMPLSRKIGMLDLVSIGRLAATVKKTAVLATVDDDDNVEYASIKWSGIS